MKRFYLLLLLFSQIAIAQQVTWQVETWPVETVGIYVPGEPLYSAWYPDAQPNEIKSPITNISDWTELRTNSMDSKQWQRIRSVGNNFIQYQNITVFYDYIEVDLDIYNEIIESINREPSYRRKPGDFKKSY